MTAIVIITDGLRWWGFMAALVGFPDALRMLSQVMQNKPRPVSLGIWAVLGLIGTFGFLGLAGLSIPISSRAIWFAQETAAFKIVVMVFWASASFGGWMLNVALTPGDNPMATAKKIMAVASAAALAVAMSASFLTYVP